MQPLQPLFLAVLAAALGGAWAYPSAKPLRAQKVALRARRRLGGDHEHDAAEKPVCGCEGDEADHPFTINCEDKASINSAADLLASPTCNMSKSAYEWGGIFATPLAQYVWNAQATGDPLAYADDFMPMVLFPSSEGNQAALDALTSAADALLKADNCTDVNTGATLMPSTDTCYNLQFTGTADSQFFLNTAAADNLAVFTGHVPLEFERDTHFFQDMSGNDVEAIATVEQYKSCKNDVNENGIKVCQQAFYILQASHDYCNHSTLTSQQELDMHVYEDYCQSCKVGRAYNPDLPDCIKPDCTDPNEALLATTYLNSTCERYGGEGTCCRTPQEIGAFDIIYAYHEFCGTDIPDEIEDGLHYYETACEEHLCNTIDGPFDPNACPDPNPPKTWEEEAREHGWRPCTGTKSSSSSEGDENGGHASHRRRRASQIIEEDDD